MALGRLNMRNGYASSDSDDDSPLLLSTREESRQHYGSKTQPTSFRSNEPPVASTSKDPIETSNPTLVLLIPYPESPIGMSSKKAQSVPPFLMYSPKAAALQAPEDGQKEDMVTKAQRKWQEEERHAREERQQKEEAASVRSKAVGWIQKGMNWTKNSRIEFLSRTPGKDKLTELRIVYPASMASDDVARLFTEQIKSVKASATRNAVIATAILPAVLVFDTLSFIPGPFEINCVFAASSIVGAQRASSITSRVTADSLPINFSAEPLMDSLAFRLHQICRKQAKPELPMAIPHWNGSEHPLEGIELAALVLAVATSHLGMTAHEQFETNLALLAEDIEDCLGKGASEWLVAVQ